MQAVNPLTAQKSEGNRAASIVIGTWASANPAFGGPGKSCAQLALSHSCLRPVDRSRIHDAAENRRPDRTVTPAL
jgi:hypothetical protein